MTRVSVLSLLACLAAACSAPVQKCVTKADCAADQTCAAGECRGISVDGGTDGGAGMVYSGCSASAPDNATRDTDCDGLTDAEEYGTDYSGKHTDPCNSDTDGDGILDGIEMGRSTSVNASCGFVGDLDPNSKTNPTVADTDGDGLTDGQEDANHNGRRDQGETNPLKKDSDCDGYSDKEERDGLAGCVTDPTLADTDGDGLPDGVEGGLQPPGADPTGCTYTAATFDADKTTRTNACKADTDGDGIQDGAEDTNKNGKVDPGELDPNNPADATGAAAQACATTNLKPITFNSSGQGDIELALVPEFMELNHVSSASGEKGLIFYDATTKVAGLAISKAPAGADANAEEQAVRALLGAVSGSLVQSYSTWDGFTNSIRASYDESSAVDVKAKINAIASALLGAGATGTLTGSAGVTGPFKIQATYVRRTANRSVVVVALLPAASYSGQTLFSVDDTAGGTALAQLGDFADTQCEVFGAEVNAKVDFLWVVDDSNSMKSSQTAVGQAGAVFASKVNSAGLDWRVGAVTTSFYTSNNAFRPFTTDIAVMNDWFNGNNQPFGIGGNGKEEPFASSQDYISGTLLPRGANGALNKIRTGATLHLITLTDTNDQSGQSAAQYTSFLQNFDGSAQSAVIHGFICPEGVICNANEGQIDNPGKIQTAIRATGGVNGDIRVANTNTPQAAQQVANTIDAILSAAIGGTGHSLSKPPIAATIKIAIETGKTKGACNTADVPRDRTNGWDIDAATRKIVFYGSCIPSAVGVKVAVSYKYWNDASPNPDGDGCGGTCQAPLSCDPGQKQCVCTDCGGCGAGLTCNKTTCVCDPQIN